jgi:hypothetical protein
MTICVEALYCHLSVAYVWLIVCTSRKCLSLWRTFRSIALCVSPGSGEPPLWPIASPMRHHITVSTFRDS